MIPSYMHQAEIQVERNARELHRSPIRFRVVRPLFYKGKSYDKDSVIDVPTANATDLYDLYGCTRAELVDPEDMKRLRILVQAASLANERAAKASSPLGQRL